MKTTFTLTVGIPAFNEEANIRFILKDLLAQNVKGYKLDKIIVNSDGSDDNTIKEAAKVKSHKIQIVNNKKRAGRVHRQNEIIKATTSDVLVLIDADTQIKDKFFLKKITQPIFYNKADLTSVRVQELPQSTFLGKTLGTSMKLKKQIFESVNNGNNLYTCHGRARAFSKNLYSSIKFKDSINEDAFSYLYAISNNFKYKFVRNTEIYYQLPENIVDHENQSIRYLQSKTLLEKDFTKNVVSAAYRLPLQTVLFSLTKFFINNPISLISYLGVFALSNIKAKYIKSKNTWVISKSSKKLRKATI